MKNAGNIAEVLQLYNEGTWFFALFLAAAAYLLTRLEKAQRRHAVITAAAAVLIVLNDVSFQIVKSMQGAETYYRFLWMIPVVPMLAYVAVDLLIAQKTLPRKALLAAVMAGAFVLAGNTYLPEDDIQASGVHFLNGSVVDICRRISEDKPIEYPKVACDISLIMSIRLQDATVRNAISRWTYENDATAKIKGQGRKCQHRLLTLVSGGDISAKKVKSALKISKTNYVVIASEYNKDEVMQKAGCSILAVSGAYTIYRVPDSLWGD